MYKCIVCGSEFKSKMSLAYHILSRRGDKHNASKAKDWAVDYVAKVGNPSRSAIALRKSGSKIINKRMV